MLYFYINVVLLVMNIFSQELRPPVARKIPYSYEIHGYKIVDNYAWLKDRSETKDPEILEYLTNFNTYTDSVMAKVGSLKEKIYQEMLGRIQQDDSSVPYQKGNYFYYYQFKKGLQYPIYYRFIASNPEKNELLLDVNELSKGYTYFKVNSINISDNGKILAYSTDNNGYRQYSLQFKDLIKNTLLKDKFERVTSFEWGKDSKTVYFSTEDKESKRSDKVFKYTLGENNLELIFEEKDVLFDTFVQRSLDGKMLFICSSAKTMTEFQFLPLENTQNSTQPLQVLIPRKEGLEYSAYYDQDRFYILTNMDGATNFKVMSASLKNNVVGKWTEWMPHNPDIKIEQLSFFNKNIIVSEKEVGLEYLRVIDKKNMQSYRIPMEESVYTCNLSFNYEYNTDSVLYQYSSFITPRSFFKFDFEKKNSTIIKADIIPSGHDKNKYVTKRIWINSRDNVKIPIVLLMKKDTKLDGTAPLYQYSYGSYGVSMAPNFSSGIFSLIDRGVIYALAQIRGGGELGEPWRLEGRMNKKMNTFNDFIDVSKFFIQEKYTTANKLVAHGGSAGGLLMGVVANNAPMLYKAMIMSVPFVDIMNTMLDESLPLTTSEWLEWGNPNIKEEWDYMVQYSPYDNVKEQEYPNLMIEVSVYDSQVPYWEGAKLAAKILEMKKNTNNTHVMLKTNFGAGHGGASGRFDALKEKAYRYAYILEQMGITD